MAVLLRATEIAFTKHGFAHATTNRIAEIAGVSIGTLYHYFPTKESLVQAIVHRMWSEELEALLPHAHLLTDAPLHVATHALAHALCGTIAKRRELVKRWYAEASHLGDLQTGLDMSDAMARLVHDALAARRDEVRPRDLVFAADLVVKTALAVARTGSRDYPSQLADGTLADELADMLTRYLLKEPPA